VWNSLQGKIIINCIWCRVDVSIAIVYDGGDQWIDSFEFILHSNPICATKLHLIVY